MPGEDVETPCGDICHTNHASLEAGLPPCLSLHVAGCDECRAFHAWLARVPFFQDSDGSDDDEDDEDEQGGGDGGDDGRGPDEQQDEPMPRVREDDESGGTTRNRRGRSRSPRALEEKASKASAVDRALQMNEMSSEQLLVNSRKKAMTTKATVSQQKRVLGMNTMVQFLQTLLLRWDL